MGSDMKKGKRGRSGCEYVQGSKKHRKSTEEKKDSGESERGTGKGSGRKEVGKMDRSPDGRKAGFQRIEFDEASCTIRVKGDFTLKDIKRRFENLKSVKSSEGGFVLEYPSKEHALVDMKANRRPRGVKKEKNCEYLDNKYILTNLSYKETEESISETFGKYGEIERVTIKKNRDCISTGKAIITFKKRTFIKDEIIMSNKPIYIERIKKPLENKRRFFLSKLKKSHSIVAIRKILSDAGCKPKDIRVLYGENKRNRGYGFIEYDSEKDADVLVSKFEEIRDLLGPECYYEYSNEKISSRKK
ncbi:putative RNA-binding protein [Encephalitozoon cuniculi EcunIII-L]|nr:putative RNA-binding protein [Encephalitozoon cuniculi EcunIII-L]